MSEMSQETQDFAAADGFTLDTPVIEYRVSDTDLATLGFNTDVPALFYLSTPRGGFPGSCILIGCGYGHGSLHPVGRRICLFLFTCLL